MKVYRLLQIGSDLAYGTKKSFSIFSRDELEAFLEQYEQSNRAVARDYLGNENQPLFAPPGGSAAEVGTG